MSWPVTRCTSCRGSGVNGVALSSKDSATPHPTAAPQMPMKAHAPPGICVPRSMAVRIVASVAGPPELRYAAKKTAVSDVRLAVNDRRKNAEGEWVDEPTFVDVTLWARTAEVAIEYLSKGSPVLIEGRLRLDQWETNDGQKRSKLKVVCDRMQMLGTRDGNGKPADGDAAPGEPDAAANGEKEIPF